MSKAIYCPFPACTVEYYTYCAKHRAIVDVVNAVADTLDPIQGVNNLVVYNQLKPMIKQLEEQHQTIYQLQNQLEHGNS